MSYIYKITNLVNGKVYIGETNRTIEIRWKQHKARTNDASYTAYLYNAIRKYGVNNFSVEELEECLPENRFERETYYILKFNSLAPNGYNLVLSQNGPTNEMIDAILVLWGQGASIVKIGEILHLNPKTISGYLKGNGVSQEEIMSRRSKNAGLYSSKIVYRYSLEGEFLDEWPSASEAARNFKCNIASIGKCCKGNILTYNGYIWQYKESDDIEERVLLVKSKNKVGLNKKPILCFDLEHNFICEYESASAAGRAFGVAHAGIAYAARTGGTALGYYWQYKT